MYVFWFHAVLVLQCMHQLEIGTARQRSFRIAAICLALLPALQDTGRHCIGQGLLMEAARTARW